MVDTGVRIWTGFVEMTEVLDAILLLDGLILATLGMDKGKCDYVGCISGRFLTLRVAPRVTDG